MNLASRREVVAGSLKLKTPLLVPSFSSKVLGDINKTIETMAEFITDATLVSAYDIHHHKIKGPLTFPSLLIVDSGGYESLTDHILEDLEYTRLKPKKWDLALYEKTVKSWNRQVPTALVSYDHPNLRRGMDSQIKAANKFFRNREGIAKVFLVKPETKKQRYLNVDTLTKNAHMLGTFDVIGLTEKELGKTLLDKMLTVAKLRQALTVHKLNTPIHIFGSLDTISTPLYFLAGADIFDGLTWLRFAFHEGFPVYQNSFFPLKFDLNLKDDMVAPRCWAANIQELSKMQLCMNHYIAQHDFECFSFHKKFLKDSFEIMSGHLKED